MMLGVRAKLPPLDKARRWPLVPCVSRSILRLAASAWERSAEELDIKWLAYQFTFLYPEQQEKAVLLANLLLAIDPLDPTKREHLMKKSDAIPADIMARLDTSLASLEASLLAKDPMMPQHLRNIHSVLISYPEAVTLLEDNEIARLIDAAEVHTKTEIVKAVAKGKSSGGRAKVSLDSI